MTDENPNVADLHEADAAGVGQTSQDQPQIEAVHPSEPDMMQPGPYVWHFDASAANAGPVTQFVGDAAFALPRPTPPSVNADHQAVLDYLHAVIDHLRLELRALGVRVGQ